jgi:hypothetical protein
MSAFERFLADPPDMAERPYGDAMAATLQPGVPNVLQLVKTSDYSAVEFFFGTEEGLFFTPLGGPQQAGADSA